MRTWHLFPGGNTAHGFVGFFQNLRDHARRTVILKGGPGVGKSTLMRDVGRHYEELGMEVGYFHCSGDPDSLDAVLVREADFLILDGTAPHLVDPVCPGARDGILNLGVCLDESVLSAQEKEISLLQKEISSCYAQAYHDLRSALEMRNDAALVYRAALSEKEERLLCGEISALIPSGQNGMDSHAFCQAITYQGVLQRMDSVLQGNIYCLDVPWGFDADGILRRVWEAAWQRGVRRTAFHDPLNAGMLSHVRVGDAVFTTAVMLDEKVFSPSLEKAVLRRHSARLAFDRAACALMENQAVEALSQAKEKHDALERYYIDAMDYDRLNEIKRRFLKNLP